MQRVMHLSFSLSLRYVYILVVAGLLE